MTATEPIRSCVGCGARAPQGVLARMTWREGGLRVDTGVRAPGRGAYVHRRTACWDAFVARRGPVRSLRVTVDRRQRELAIERLAAITGREEV